MTIFRISSGSLNRAFTTDNVPFFKFVLAKLDISLKLPSLKFSGSNSTNRTVPELKVLSEDEGTGYFLGSDSNSK